MPPEKIRVVTDDVGGGFGMKGFDYPEYFVIAAVARELGRPVRWMSERTEGILTDNGGRDLISDTDETLCQLFDVIKEKNMYGRKVMGVERSTFLIDAGGKLRREWRKVKVDGHAEEVLAAARELNRE